MKKFNVKLFWALHAFVSRCLRKISVRFTRTLSCDADHVREKGKPKISGLVELEAWGMQLEQVPMRDQDLVSKEMPFPIKQ